LSKVCKEVVFFAKGEARIHYGKEVQLMQVEKMGNKRGVGFKRGGIEATAI
jgi:hypothetical protein